MKRRLAFALLVAICAATYVARLAIVMPYYGTDFDPVRYAARLVLHGQNPYALIGPGRPVFWNFRLLYPLPAVLVAMPFLAMPIVAARALFVGITSGLLAFVMTRKSWWPALVFLSASWWYAIGVAQWSPGLLAATSLPWLGFLVAAKPNMGLAVLAAASSWRAFIILTCTATAIAALSFVVMPHWLAGWQDATRDTPHVRPLVAIFGGPLLLLASLRWRRPDARLLLALAIIPMNPALYEGILLFAIPTSAIEAGLLALASWFVDPLSHSPFVTASGFASAGQAMLVCMYFPALVLVLRHPNIGPAPAWIERIAERLPPLLRGARPADTSSDDVTHLRRV
jgi:hypothetical protein